MSSVNEIRFAVEQAVLDIGVKIVFPVIEGIDNTLTSPEWMEKRKEIINHLLEEYKDIDYHADPILEGFHILHDRTGVKRRKNIPASENLIRLLNKHCDVFFINQAVDIYNIISMESKLALGAHDIDHVDGNVTLRFTDGTERFVPIGQDEPVPNNPHNLRELQTVQTCTNQSPGVLALQGLFFVHIHSAPARHERQNVAYVIRLSQTLRFTIIFCCAKLKMSVMMSSSKFFLLYATYLWYS